MSSTNNPPNSLDLTKTQWNEFRRQKILQSHKLHEVLKRGLWPPMVQRGLWKNMEMQKPTRSQRVWNQIETYPSLSLLPELSQHQLDVQNEVKKRRKPPSGALLSSPSHVQRSGHDQQAAHTTENSTSKRPEAVVVKRQNDSDADALSGHHPEKCPKLFNSNDRKRQLILARIDPDRPERTDTALTGGPYYEFVLKKRKEIAGSRDIFHVINTLRQDPELGFLYLKLLHSPRSLKYSPYLFKVVSRDEVNKDDYYTISQNCIVHYRNGNVEEVSLERFVHEHYAYNCMQNACKSIRYFVCWKQFMLWSNSIRRKHFESVQSALRTDMFHLDRTLHEALCKAHDLCLGLMKDDNTFVDNNDAFLQTYTMTDFLEAQYRRREQVLSMFEAMRATLLNILLHAVAKLMHAREFNDVAEKLLDSANADHDDDEGSILSEVPQQRREGSGRNAPQSTATRQSSPPTFGGGRHTQEGGGGGNNDKNRPVKVVDNKESPFGTTPTSVESPVSAGNSDYTSRPTKQVPSTTSDEELQGNSVRTFTTEFAKRKFCFRMSKFLRLVDYMILSTLHDIVEVSMKQLLNKFDKLTSTTGDVKQLTIFTPRSADSSNQKKNDGTGGSAGVSDMLAELNSEHQLQQPAGSPVPGQEAVTANPTAPTGVVATPSGPQPLWLTECSIKEGTYCFTPSYFDFQKSLRTVLEGFFDTVNEFKLFSDDDAFEAILRPEINGEEEEAIFEELPSIEETLQGDHHLVQLKQDLDKNVKRAFCKADELAQRFRSVLDFYEQDKAQNLEDFRTKPYTSAEYAELLSKFFDQLRQAQSIITAQNLGLIKIDLKLFKDEIVPAPLKCIEALALGIPFVARQRLTQLTDETNHALQQFTMDPTNTEDYVALLNFFEHCLQRIEPLEVESDEVKAIYSLMDVYGIAAPSEDFAINLSLGLSVQKLRSAIDKMAMNKDQVLDSLAIALAKDVGVLNELIKTLKKNINDPIFTEDFEKRDEAVAKLKQITEEIRVATATARRYQQYQKHFSFEILLYEELDEVEQDCRLRQLLWDSVVQFEDDLSGWLELPLPQINIESMQQQILKYSKNVSILEKGLPPNRIVPELKLHVDSIKHKIPILQDLTNKNFKPRHIAKLERLLQRNEFNQNPPNMEELETLGAFGRAEEIRDISGQASSEASLEALLKKIEDSWRQVELIVLPHREQKDVFILGGLDDIQALLDDSIINITVIASARHVGPIRPRVEEWERMLNLFQKTLEEWQTCQRSWLYLESVFLAPDIQRQLPYEAKLFSQVDRTWKDVMRKVHKVPLAIRAGTQPNLYETFQECNQMLDEVMKCLERYLESKRVIFPRFYFLSNDELLSILAETRNPAAVQPHLRKCFDAVVKLDFASVGGGGPAVPAANDAAADQNKSAPNAIVGFSSAEQEYVEMSKNVKARGNVEDWLGRVEEAIVYTLRKITREAITEYDVQDRTKWLQMWPSQVVITVNQIMWCRSVCECLGDNVEDPVGRLKRFEIRSFESLNYFASLVRGKLTSLFRKVLCALITVDVHARDIVTELRRNEVTDTTSFDWNKQLRYFWEDLEDRQDCLVRMATSSYVYGYEYLGASPRLVITPLTDRCYLCLMGALELDLGGAPAGPAGTGKTETTKDLAKALAKQCVVFNCSESLNFRMMGRFFAGLAQSGAWCCFDEFNRIDIEVLSVIAQQLQSIRNAKVAKNKKFWFEGREIRLVRSCAAFITMNPGYAGRTELPDNLKALFRPMSMMVPDYALIAEVILYSEGFESSRVLARKMVQMYKLCSEQLSSQSHYDFGMRALKSVLVMAGGLKRSSGDVPEDIVLVRALRDSNLPKFLSEDVILFSAILQDLFPGSVIPEQDYDVMQKAIAGALGQQGLDVAVDKLIAKTIQFYETLQVRHGVMLVGGPGGGKTTVYEALAGAITALGTTPHREANPYYRPVHTFVLNPKAVTMGELYGEVNPLNLEWRDGLLGISIREAVNAQNDDHQWIVCDGPVDALWIENMNTTLDDNKMLCLANSERIKLKDNVVLLFEVEDLAQASPATVSRCGMVYVDPDDLGWRPLVKTWLTSLSDKFEQQFLRYVWDLFDTSVDNGLLFVRQNCREIVKQMPITKVSTICTIMESLLMDKSLVAPEVQHTDTGKMNGILATCYVFSYVWGVGGNLTEQNSEAFEAYARSQFEGNLDAKLPANVELLQNFVDFEQVKFVKWERIVPRFVFDRQAPFSKIVVPTVDTVKFGYIMHKIISQAASALLIGDSGVGKSMVAKLKISELVAGDKYVANMMAFSAQTTSTRTQMIIEGKLEKKRKNVLQPSHGKQMILFIDDVNMPKPDTYGSQPPIELIRQYQDFHGMYDREKLFWKEIQDVTVCGACGPPGGGRNMLSNRFTRHFTVIYMASSNENNLRHVCRSILTAFFSDFSPAVKAAAGEPLVSFCVEIYQRMIADFLPTPSKAHYVFNQRDLSKLLQGLLRANDKVIVEKNDVIRIAHHEAMRVFHDRLVSEEDRNNFYQLLSEVTTRYYAESTTPASFRTQPLLFGDFMKMGAPPEERVYQDISNDSAKLIKIIDAYQEDYSHSGRKDEMHLVLFQEVLTHVCAVIRIIESERGNGLLVGVGGTGRKSTAKLAAHCCGYQIFEIELSRSYDQTAFREDLKKLYEITGAKNIPCVFLLSDTQIVDESFLEDLNGVLNTGEVPNLFEGDEIERLLAVVRPAAKDAGFGESRDAAYEFFLSRVTTNLHIVLCMSPIGASFRTRCRMFPALISCTTIDWFNEWPPEALKSVSSTLLEPNMDVDAQTKQHLARMCAEVHSSVQHEAEKFYNEMKRRFYTTPTSYLELVSSFQSLLARKRSELTDAKSRYKNGLNKIQETELLVKKMRGDLVALEPVLQEKNAATEVLVKQLAVDGAAADQVRQRVQEDEREAKVKADDVAKIKNEAQADLDEALPALEAAVKALDSLDKNDISEVRVFNKPPELVQVVMEAICIMLNAKTDWQTARQVLGDPYFLKRLQEFDKDNLPEVKLRKLKPYIDNPKFVPEVVEKTSRACKSLCMWVRAIDLYARVFKQIAPKRAKLAEAEQEFKVVQDTLMMKQEQLAQVEQEVGKLKAMFEQSVRDKAQLESNIELTSARLKRAVKLTTALADGKEQWARSVEDYDARLKMITGDVFIASACVAYEGAFTASYREELVRKWQAQCDVQNPDGTKVLAISSPYALENVLSDSFQVREWNNKGLPRDALSIENAIIAVNGRRWPLMIDPQGQALRWVKGMEADSGLIIIKPGDASFMRQLENGIRLGRPVLLEDLGETIDPALEPVLLKQTFVSNGQTLIRLGDADVEYDKNFRFYMTTKLSNPHYMPEVCVKVTIINFTVTPVGLEDQLLSDVVRLERPDLEHSRTQLIVSIFNDRMQLKQIEDKVLRLLFNSKGNILDDEELIEALTTAKITADAISSRLRQAEQTEIVIGEARDKYRAVARRGSVIFFVVTSLSTVDPMYEFSLRYFQSLFCRYVESSEKTTNLNKRLQILIDGFTQVAYTNISRGLFERDKLVFSFKLCLEILRSQNRINDDEWNFFLRGSTAAATTSGASPTSASRPSGRQAAQDGSDDGPKPTAEWLMRDTWLAACTAQTELANACPDITTLVQNEKLVLELGRLNMVLNPEIVFKPAAVSAANPEADANAPKTAEESVVMPPQEPLPSEWLKNVSSFQKLVLVKLFKTELLVQAMQEFVRTELGQQFIESPSVQLSAILPELSYTTPLVFVLTTGTDPMSVLLKCAHEQNAELKAISLGQSQGPVAEGMINEGLLNGEWVFLQNCHLAASWMPSLERVVKNIQEGSAASGTAAGTAGPPRKLNTNFRLFMTSMPTKKFPISVLQNSLKVTFEPPQGVKSGLRRAYTNMDKEFLESNPRGAMWSKMVYCLCMFHAIVQERRKFGSLGWNIRYEFTESDRDCALKNLTLFCEGRDDDDIPWEALSYITGEITYGGRVTDSWDQRCLNSLLRSFFNANIVENNSAFFGLNAYAPIDSSRMADYQHLIANLPSLESPALFGLHENANVALMKNEALRLQQTLIELQPKAGGGGGSGNTDALVLTQATTMLERLNGTSPLVIEHASKELFIRDAAGRMPSLTTVLLHEVERYNQLLVVLKKSLNDMLKAVKGLLVMNEELERVYQALLVNIVPQSWMRFAYPSLKPLSSWIKDLCLRIEFLYNWAHYGNPASYWLPGFFFPQGFLTGVLQAHARKYQLPIDEIIFKYLVQASYINQGEVQTLAPKAVRSQFDFAEPDDGVMVHGLFLEACGWDDNERQLRDCHLGEIHSPLPMVHFLPDDKTEIDPNDYECPMYKTAERAGVLSTTGHSTNFIISVHLPTEVSQDTWITRAAALLCQLPS